MEPGCLARKIQEHPVEAALVILSIIIFSTLGATLGAYRVSLTIMGLLLLYILIQGAPLQVRLIPLSAALAAHIAAILSYYSNPIILPLVVVERSIEYGYSVNIDIVQIALLYEARQILKEPPTCTEHYEEAEEAPSGPENSKTPDENTLETGEGAPR